MKKFFAFMLIALVIISSLLIVTSAKKQTVLKICASDQWWGGSKDSTLQAAVIREMEKKTGIKIKQIMPVHASYKEKLNLLLTSGDKPDVMWVFQAMNFIPAYAVRGDIIPLDDYIAKSPAASAVDPKVYNLLKINGKTFFIPVNKPATKFLWMRKDLVEKYGITLSTTPTTDEFLTEMKKVVAADKKMIAFSFPKFIDNFQFFYNTFGAYGNVYNKGGKYIDGFQEKEIKDALLYIKKLYDEGVWHKEFITVDNNKLRENLIKGFAVSNIDYYFRYSFYIDESTKAKTATDFIPVYKIVGPTGAGGSLNEAIQDAWAISNTCKDPEAAFKFIEWQVFTAEGRQLTSVGIRSLHYSVNEKGVATARDEAKQTGYNLTPNFIFNSFPDFSEKGFQWDSAVLKSLPKQVAFAKEQLKHIGPAYAAPVGKSKRFDEVNLSIKQKREEVASNVVLGSKTLEDAFKDYLNYWNSIEGDKILDELNK